MHLGCQCIGSLLQEPNRLIQSQQFKYIIGALESLRGESYLTGGFVTETHIQDWLPIQPEDNSMLKLQTQDKVMNGCGISDLECGPETYGIMLQTEISQAGRLLKSSGSSHKTTVGLTPGCILIIRQIPVGPKLSLFDFISLGISPIVRNANQSICSDAQDGEKTHEKQDNTDE